MKTISFLAQSFYVRLQVSLRTVVRDERGQGTTEYAILVGVLVVIAILSITIFRPKIDELWNAIAEGINDLYASSMMKQGRAPWHWLLLGRGLSLS